MIAWTVIPGDGARHVLFGLGAGSFDDGQPEGLVVDDLPAAHDRLVEAGVDTFVSPPIEVDTGINTGGYGLYLRDPDGILVEIFQPPAAR